MKLSLILFLFLLTACSSEWLEYSRAPISQCYKDGGAAEVAVRRGLFNKLPSHEISRRQKISIPLYPRKGDSSSGDETVINKVIDAYNKSPANTNLVGVDLRNYQDINLVNIIFSDFTDEQLSDEWLNANTEYSQGLFLLFNANTNGIVLKIGPNVEDIDTSKLHKIISRKDLSKSELVINASQHHRFAKSGKYTRIMGNVKFSGGKKFSILADNIPVKLAPYGEHSYGIQLDLRQVINPRETSDPWLMQVYSIKNSGIRNGKDTWGNIAVVNNTNLHHQKLQSFQVTVSCYSDAGNPLKGE